MAAKKNPTKKKVVKKKAKKKSVAKKRPTEKKSGVKGGRPSDYDPAYNEQARKLCILGYIDEELADFFQKHVSTIYEWKKKHPKFSEAINAGRDLANADVADSLYNRAMGYTHKSEHIHVNAKGDVTRVAIDKHYPPDSTACIFFLKNRDRTRWQDKQNHEINPGDELKELMGMIPSTLGPPGQRG